MVAVYVHAPSHDIKRLSSIVLLCAGMVQTAVFLTRLDNLIRRNMRAGKVFNKVDIKGMEIKKIPVQDTLEIHIWLRRSWTLEAGQYVCLRGHPFYIARWYTEGNEKGKGKIDDVIVLVVERRDGFTNRLFDKWGQSTSLIEGPYGKRLDLWKLGNGVLNQATDKYTDFILFATGIGIIGQLSYINEILLSSRYTRIKLFWEIDRKGKSCDSQKDKTNNFARARRLA